MANISKTIEKVIMKLRGLELKNTPRIAGVLTAPILSRDILIAQRDGAHIIELRVDSFPKKELDDLESMVDKFKLFRRQGTPIILTIRKKSEGGILDLTPVERKKIFKELIPYCDAVDIEVSSGIMIKEVVAIARKNDKKVIISHHDFKGTPDDKKLMDIYKKSKKLGADIIKVATLVKTQEDLRALGRLLLKTENLIIIGMGKKGVPTRTLFPLMGSLITYGTVTGSTAPGQLSVKELKKAFS